ncbi:MAG: membrane protein insertion efficiency factor YidD [bacterium]
MKQIVIQAIKMYRKLKMRPAVCRYYPSCSEYMILSIEKYGLIKGILKGLIRIVRCNPLGKGGIDYP